MAARDMDETDLLIQVVPSTSTTPAPTPNTSGDPTPRTSHAQVDSSSRSLVPSVSFRHKYKNSIILCVIFGLMMLASLIVTILVFVTLMAPPKIHLHCGFIQGVHSRNGYSFRSIPYAEAPSKYTRWQAPEPPTGSSCWKGTWNSDHPPNQCIQKTSNGDVVGSEDCLYLSVYTPSTDGDLLPVMVYFHDGDLRSGNISDDHMQPSVQIADRYNFVMVSVQYRLDVFGFLNLDGIEPNLGFKDQLLALEWVQENIRKFGGDAKRVTIYGGSSVSVLLASPVAVGLFHKAWIISGSVYLDKTVHQAQQDNKFLLRKFKCTDIECLREVNARDLLAATSPEWDDPGRYDLPKLGETSPSFIVYRDDDEFLPEPPLTAWITHALHIPVMIGSTAQETAISLPIGLKAMNESTMDALIDDRLGTFNDSGLINHTYSLYPYNMTAELTYTTICSDIRQTCIADEYAHVIGSTATSNVYRYVVDVILSSNRTDISSKSKYASHGVDLLAFFDRLGSSLDQSLSKSDEDFVAHIVNNIVSFVKSGRPSDKRWFVANNVTALISGSMRFNPDPFGEKCGFWDQANFTTQYSWGY